MLQMDDVIDAGVLLREIEPRAVVEDVAVLQDFNVGRALVRGGFLQRVLQVLLEDVHRAGHERRIGADHEAQRIERRVRRAVGRGLGFLAEFRRRRILPLRQPVNLVVEHQHLDADVPSQHVNRVVATDGQRIAVASRQPHFEFRMRDLDSGGYGRPAAMDRMEAERIHVIREAARTPNPGNDDKLFAGNPQLRENGLHGGENGVVPAAGAPADFLVGLKIFLR